MDAGSAEALALRQPSGLERGQVSVDGFFGRAQFLRNSVEFVAQALVLVLVLALVTTAVGHGLYGAGDERGVGEHFEQLALRVT
ncbi:hypothetical protein DY218_01240 [Streptomyces triticagri]|uniref:Uncharacterized protein n=1 Tax=Streptomyces triticagri TaxID=2293568 RepID=A0A372MDU8_9ACTN|nr:hypothetical protein [Streptomyces triticagri]RFU88477.1 hypothetical protein DY218_01240 [Streptomyces triticagri]